MGDNVTVTTLVKYELLNRYAHGVLEDLVMRVKLMLVETGTPCSFSFGVLHDSKPYIVRYRSLQISVLYRCTFTCTCRRGTSRSLSRCAYSWPGQPLATLARSESGSTHQMYWQLMRAGYVDLGLEIWYHLTTLYDLGCHRVAH